MALRITGAVQIILGLIIWTGKADGLTGIHILVGVIVVLTLWALAVMAFRAAVSRPLAIVAFVWGLVVPIVGLAQTSILKGNGHWVIQVVHLLLGLGAIGLGEALAARMLRS
jgi:hypothetical protein